MKDIKLIDYKDRIINLFSDVCEETANEVIKKIIEINIKDTDYINSAMSIIQGIGFNTDPNNIALPPIILNLSTFGGDVYSGWGICDAVKTSETSVKCVCYGKVMSMGIPILLSAEHKIAHKNTTFMIHDVSTAVWGKAQDIKESLDETIKLRNQYVDFICSNTKFPRKKFEEIIEKKQDYYFTAEEALKYKFIDAIIDIEDIQSDVEEQDIDKKTKSKTKKDEKSKQKSKSAKTKKK